ncbi:MAG: D-glycero-beta-D-manno-heptose-7-phosphate kinase [Bacteroidetes bacterium]|nr:D-glycero-beta-D-manno-heptose-7-phosphate kinase [Bacteroidota bacterium]
MIIQLKVDRLTIEKFKNTRVLVLGDVMIDAYLFGKVERISPEAPVPVVAVVHKENRLGGAANVAVNLVALGAKPILCSVVGNDAEGKDLIDLIKSSGIGADGIIQSKERVTTIKTRVISQSTQMLRIDNEITDSLNQEDDSRLISKVKELLKEADVIIFEDYDKGVISEHLISQITQEANALNIPIVVDPKKRNFMSYQKASLFKPNLKELREGFKRDFDIDNKEEFESVCKDLMQDMGLKNLFVTLSERGVMITNGNEFYYIPAHLRKIADVSGAGDTVISVASLCMALGLPLKQVAQISNLAGGLVCEEVGVVPINKEKLIEEIESIDW